MPRTARLKINCLISDRYYSNNKLTSEPLIFKGDPSKCENQTGSFGAAARVKVCQLDGGRHSGSENYKKPSVWHISVWHISVWHRSVWQLPWNILIIFIPRSVSWLLTQTQRRTLYLSRQFVAATPSLSVQTQFMLIIWFNSHCNRQM